MYHNLFNPPPTSGRCECGAELGIREDDKEETVRKRVVVYRSQTLPLLEYYGQKEILCAIDASPTIENVQKEALKALCANA
jgi:adenylate kinase